MKRLMVLPVVLLSILLIVSTVACSSESASAPCMSYEEAIALAQDKFNEDLSTILCEEGRNQLISDYQGGEWGICDEAGDNETEFICVQYCSQSGSSCFGWNVYCDSLLGNDVGWGRFQNYMTYCD